MNDLKTKIKYHKTEPKFEIQILVGPTVEAEDIIVESRLNEVRVVYKNPDDIHAVDVLTDTEWEYATYSPFDTLSFHKHYRIDGMNWVEREKNITSLTVVLSDGILTISGTVEPIVVNTYGVVNE